MNTELYCSGCKTQKPVECFSRNKAHKRGYANWCKSCISNLNKRPENLERRKNRRNGSLEHSLLVEVRCRARKRGIPFDLTEGDIIIPDVCPVLGIKIVRSQGKLAPETPTVDKIIPELGYVKGNVAVISWRANRLKSDCGDPRVFEAIAQYIRLNSKTKII